MPRYAALSAMLALASGLLPGARPLDASELAQASSNVVQGRCPTVLDLEAGPSNSVRVNTSIDQVWVKVRSALEGWAKPDSSSKPPTTLRATAILIVEPVLGSGQKSESVGRTCFYEWRKGNTDTRLAFRFSPRAVSGKMPATDVDVKWLSQTKGSAQRTWRNSTADQMMLDRLFSDLRGKTPESS